MYQKKLENDGYEVATATDGVMALSSIEAFKPQLILLDIMMPKMNGLQVLTKLKENPQTSNIPVILLTNVFGSDEDVDRGLELGAVAYLVKAGNKPKVVVEKVKEILAGYVHELPHVESVIQDVNAAKVAEEKRKALEEIDQANKDIEAAQKKAEEAKRKLANS
jgi:DNA-binding response OmpR family regulator